MTDEVKNETVSEPVPEPETASAEPAKNEKEDKKKKRQAEAEVAELKKQLEATKKELAEKNDSYLRLAAEYDNFRRRSAKEREGIYTDAYGDALSALFPVVDNLERAAQYTDGESVAKGVSMVLKSVRETFEKLGVTEIPTEKFDPNLHNAVMHIEDEKYGENTVAACFQTGFMMGEKVIRFAMVQVAN